MANITEYDKGSPYYKKIKDAPLGVIVQDECNEFILTCGWSPTGSLSKLYGVFLATGQAVANPDYTIRYYHGKLEISN